MKLERDLLVGTHQGLENWPPREQNRVRVLRSSFEFLDGFLRAANQLYTTNAPPDMRVVRIFGYEELPGGHYDQRVGVMSMLVASAGFQSLSFGDEIPVLELCFTSIYDPRALPGVEVQPHSEAWERAKAAYCTLVGSGPTDAWVDKMFATVLAELVAPNSAAEKQLRELGVETEDIEPGIRDADEGE